jgi:hypothetical protein
MIDIRCWFPFGVRFFSLLRWCFSSFFWIAVEHRTHTVWPLDIVISARIIKSCEFHAIFWFTSNYIIDVDSYVFELWSLMQANEKTSKWITVRISCIKIRNDILASVVYKFDNSCFRSLVAMRRLHIFLLKLAFSALSFNFPFRRDANNLRIRQ